VNVACQEKLTACHFWHACLRFRQPCSTGCYEIRVPHSENVAGPHFIGCFGRVCFFRINNEYFHA